MSNNSYDNCDNCDRECKEHSNNTNRISILESKYGVVEKTNTTVSKLSSKVSMLLLFMTLIVMIVSGGAIYTFTGVNSFKTMYFNDRIILNKELTNTNDKNRQLIVESINNLDSNINTKINSINVRINSMREHIVKLETKIESSNSNNHYK